MIASPSKASPSGYDEPITLDSAIRCLLELDDEAARQRWIIRCIRSLPIDQLLASLNAEAVRYFAVNGHTSLRLASALVDAADLTNRSDARALGLLLQADAFRVLGHFQESVALYEEARRAFLAQGDEVGWARTHTGWIYSMHFLGRGLEALKTVEPAYNALVRHQSWHYAARLDQNTAAVHYWLGQYDEALRHYDRAQEAFAPLGAVAEVDAARAKANQAIILTLLGDFHTALALHLAAHEVFIRHGATAQAHRHDLHIADLYASQGHYTRALRLYNEAYVALDHGGEDVDAAWAALNIVTCYLSLNRNTEALELAEETVVRFERCGTPTEAAKARFSCALAHARLGNREQALSLLYEAAQTFAVTGLTTDLGIAALQRARLYLSEEEWSAAVAEAEDARAIFAERHLVIREAQADLIRARALLNLGQIESAANTAQSVLKTVHERDIQWLTPEGNHVLAGVARARGNLRQALTECRVAIDGIEQVQSRLAVELRGSFLEDKLEVYHDAIDCCLRLSELPLAFAFLERAKSRALVDYLAIHPDVRVQARGVENQQLADELARLRGEHDWLYDRVYGFGINRRPDDAQAAAETSALQAAIRERETRIARILERLALHRAEGYEAHTELPVNGEPILPTPDGRTVLLEYYLHERGSAVFIVTSHGLDVVELDVTPAAIRRMMHRWQLNLDATARALSGGTPLDGLARNARGILESLYQMLLEPVADSLTATDFTRLVVVPYGPTHAVPFHALFDGHRHLMESIEVISCPSSSLFQLCSKRSRHDRTESGALVIGYSDGGRLPYALEEAKRVGALLPGACFVEEGATRGALVENAPRYGIVHLAAHGEARLDNPTFAHLKLADGQLSPSDVFNLRLDGALVTLSACETGRSIVVGGDEVIGLSRGFLYAGAATLVQSLWRVEDSSTAELMERFYRGLRDGRSSGGALREAQRSLLADRNMGAHPYFWAPFQLIGASVPLEIGG